MINLQIEKQFQVVIITLVIWVLGWYFVYSETRNNFQQIYIEECEEEIQHLNEDIKFYQDLLRPPLER